METFGILFTIPGAFFASALYRVVLVMARSRWIWIKPLFLPASYVVLIAILAEWTLLGFRGPIEARVLLGAEFYNVHLLLLLFGTPALINALVLPTPQRRWAQWCYTLPLATALAFVLVVQQYSVFESLYGIDGADGPFSLIDHPLDSR